MKTEVPPPGNPPPMSFRQARRYWLILCVFSGWTGFFCWEFCHGKANAEVGAVWLIIGINLVGHGVLIPLMVRARRWEELNKRNILEAMKQN